MVEHQGARCVAAAWCNVVRVGGPACRSSGPGPDALRTETGEPGRRAGREEPAPRGRRGEPAAIVLAPGLEEPGRAPRRDERPDAAAEAAAEGRGGDRAEVSRRPRERRSSRESGFRAAARRAPATGPRSARAPRRLRARRLPTAAGTSLSLSSKNWSKRARSVSDEKSGCRRWRRDVCGSGRARRAPRWRPRRASRRTARSSRSRARARRGRRATRGCTSRAHCRSCPRRSRYTPTTKVHSAGKRTRPSARTGQKEYCASSPAALQRIAV